LIRTFNKKNSKTSKISTKKKAGKKRKKNYDSSGSEEDDSDDSDYGAKRARISGEYEVAKIINARINRQGKWEFFVMWKGFGPEGNSIYCFKHVHFQYNAFKDNTWEPESHLNCSKLINEVSLSTK
jgi:hypothetical protein